MGNGPEVLVVCCRNWRPMTAALHLSDSDTALSGQY